ncbi:Glutathione-regulated potassium-efflux system ancillary protein KefF [Neolewinella maritima]|uniref:Glutathione-regulated potassium-efflux system ancillary protein KefF n=1 Tax=Neolewinella maritima TaxID=1383882 RepID=A0ABM9AY66_9BACT|nr:NAD(P)H-dependent oxidoreductase [Neolewinella maritima]CAH0999664.1 Glutathione-regulated potassium-efflux system ancillary protein KefF [Neolewinella maritima]
MSTVLVVLAHPNPDSLNGATAKSIEKALTDGGHEVRMKDLYRTEFDPILGPKDFGAWQNSSVPDDVAKEQKDIAWADALVFVYPIWWHERPAILKGWIDRTFTKGFAWDFDENGLVGKLAGKKAFVAATFGSPTPLYDALNVDMDNLFSSVEKGTLGFCGIKETKFVDEFGVLQQDRAANEAYLKRATEAAVAFLN